MRRKNLVLWIKRDGFLKNERLESTKAPSPLRSAGAIQIRLAKRRVGTAVPSRPKTKRLAIGAGTFLSP